MHSHERVFGFELFPRREKTGGRGDAETGKTAEKVGRRKGPILTGQPKNLHRLPELRPYSPDRGACRGKCPRRRRRAVSGEQHVRQPREDRRGPEMLIRKKRIRQKRKCAIRDLAFKSRNMYPFRPHAISFV